MGHRTITRKRGKGSSVYRSPRSFGKIVWSNFLSLARMKDPYVAEIAFFQGGRAPTVVIRGSSSHEKLYFPSPKGSFVGQKVNFDGDSPLPGHLNVLRLSKIPLRAPFFFFSTRDPNYPRFVASSGTFAFTEFVGEREATVVFPSKKRLKISSDVLAIMGRVAGGERILKPLMKAGTNVHKNIRRAKRTSVSTKYTQNQVDHPHGGGSSIGRPTSVSKSTPPGRKVGMLGSGRRRRFTKG